MRMQKDNSSTEWKKRFLAASRHSGGVRGYCQETGIRLDRFYYWRRRIAPRRAAAAFTAVEVVDAPDSVSCEGGKARLPDPRWLAEFLLAFGAP